MSGLNVEIGGGPGRVFDRNPRLRRAIKDKVAAMEKLRAEVVTALGQKHVEHFLGLYDLMFLCFTENVELHGENKSLQLSVSGLSRRLNGVVLNLDEMSRDLKALRIATSDLADGLAEKFLAEKEAPLPWYRKVFKGRK